jgi:hypothetical protein
MTNARWVLYESDGSVGWYLPSDGAPSAKYKFPDGDTLVSVSWMRSKKLFFEGGSVDGIAMPFSVLEELVKRGQRWHWRPSSAATRVARHK